MRYIVTFSFILISYFANSYSHSEESSYQLKKSFNSTSKSFKKSASNLTTGSFPIDKQLYARDVLTNMASISIIEEITTGNYQYVELRIFRENILVETSQYTLQYSGGIAGYSFFYDLIAERANYRFELHSFDGLQYMLLKSAHDVVAGDVYIIDGQSNAEARLWAGSSASYIDPYIRVYGTGVSTSSQPWHIGQGDGDRTTDGNTGQWGLAMANLISQTEGIPIAIFNGAHGGTAISFHERNDANPLDLTSNYGRLLNRLELTNLTAAVRGIMWYQGESDGSNTQAYYEEKFDDLYQDWKVDYPNTEQFYPIQVRSGCGGGPPLMINIQEALRKQSSLKSDMKLMTTKGIATDGCHYPFVNGYEDLGKRMANLILNDLYFAAIPDAEAPDITEAKTVGNDPSQIELTISGADALFIDASTISEFEIPNNTVLSATVQGSNTLILQLASPLSNSTVIRYYDSSPTTTIGYIEDTAGIGLASFKDFPVILFLDADNDGVSDENDQCPGLDDALIGTICDDGDPCTIGETYNANCMCANGVYQDADSDGVCDADDACPGMDDALIGTACDDGDQCTIGETYNANCMCANGNFQDTDTDGVCDADDNECILLNFEDFESGAGIWQTNGNDAALVQSTNSPSGDYSFRIRDNSGELSSFSSDVLDLSGNDQITVVFLYQTVALSAGEDFFLEISIDGGLSFQQEKQWINGVDFENNNIYHEEVELSNDKISQTSIFRFRCDGGINADEVYIDNLKIDSCPTDCPSYYIDTNNLIVPQSIAANLIIESNGIIEPNSIIDFTAGQSILLMERFEVKMGAVFHGYIQPCTN